MKLRIGSRESALAVAQAKLLCSHLESQGVITELVTMKTTGDIILDRTLDKIGGKGLFVKELDDALLRGLVDLTVHSYKDMPALIDERIPVLAVSSRADARDVLVLPEGVTEPDKTKPIGCSSARRTLQLAELYPELEVRPIRGNVLTRLAKLDSGDYSAIVLAMAGLSRLGLTGRVSRIFEPGEMLPAACQGILAVQARRDFDTALFDGFHDLEAWDASLAEREFIKALDGGCSSPTAAYAVIDGGSIMISGMYVDKNNKARKGTDSGARSDAARLGKELAARLSGGRE